MFKNKSEKPSIVSNEERMLKYLLQRDRDVTNTVTLGTKRYSEMQDMSPEEFIQTLFALQDCGWVSIKFAGNPSPRALSYVKILEPGLTYFEDQEAQEKEDSAKNLHDYKVALIGGMIGAPIGAAVTLIMQALL